ncbi:MAG: hypothetical protein QOG89_1387, partial [Thermomicrobiales bacterium]|nr:hypothetical protein [Thermomicrobiales bacterium]
MRAFDYSRPTALDEAIALMGQPNGDAGA